ncbi:small GTP-binding protein [Tritrichomonas foetus]|uniref:Small GTP-binding protein n=1 Tax=Tritrichomonas foetus TaxID=1144522 RepID=A0A1J4K9Y6_9EUKA|nr:small GTP-binding protein [Tritrichomonas foetus]|eukprot:OHT07728.1 small GTP-binding protein [Tritrichomonas foetus]
MNFFYLYQFLLTYSKKQFLNQNTKNMSDLTSPQGKKYKVVLMGSSSVGKTSLIVRFSQNSFFADQESTIGAAFVSRDVTTPKGVITLNIWDTAGQERYRSLVPKYSQGSSVIIIVFDVTDEESFESAKEWLYDARNNHNGKLIWYLVANKCDLKPEFDLEKAKQFAQEEKMEYIETSAKTGENVEAMFVDIANMVPSLPSMNQGVDLTQGSGGDKKKSGCCK